MFRLSFRVGPAPTDLEELFSLDCCFRPEPRRLPRTATPV
jgi:hypothetical protein